VEDIRSERKERTRWRDWVSLVHGMQRSYNILKTVTDPTAYETAYFVNKLYQIVWRTLETRGKLIIAARPLVFPRAGDWELEH
jgi:hypothetical protein